MEQATYQNAERRRSQADSHHLQAALTPVPDQGLRGVNSHRKECHRAERYRGNDSRSAYNDHKRNQGDQVTG